ncbi:ABC transporter permease [Stenotrophomonas pigmentata]|uniref:ABC transporter permease n=1 Tax=Stenotrophomonas pigmentata TaxID=3055080 RepID=UPI0026F108F6|nr:ABC transporter permease [Stenotrophomonas sp. 610A2]
MFKPIYGLWLRDIRKFSRSRWKIISGLAQPVLYLLVLGTGLDQVFRAAGYTSYQRFLSPGVVAIAVIIAAFISGFSVLWDRKFGFLKETLVAPLPRWQLVVGRCLGAATTAALQTSLVLGFVYLVLAQWPGSLALLELETAIFATGFLFAVLGALCGAVIEDFQAIQVIISFILMPMIFLSSALFPLPADDHSAMLGTLIRFNPVSYLVDLIRLAMGQPGSFPLVTSMCVYTGLLAGSLALCVRAFTRIDAS